MSFGRRVLGWASGAAVVSAVLLQGCSGGGTSGGGTGKTPEAVPTVTIGPSPALVIQAGELAYVVTVSVPSGDATPTGTVVISSGSYASFAATLSSGSAAINVPQALLASGSNTLTATYRPDASSLGYVSATGTTTVNGPAAATPPTVTASSVTYPTMGAPFQAIVSSTGTVFVGVPSGIQVFTPGSGGLTASCVNALGSSLTGEGGAVSELSFLPGGTNVAAGISSPGAIFYNEASLASCTATGTVVSQGTIASDQGTQAVAVTPDGKYAFVSNEYGVANGASTEGNIGVVQLAYDGSGNVSGGTLVGQISTGGQAIAGMLLSPDGTRLYVTSEIAGLATQGQGSSNTVLARTGCVQAAGSNPQINGILTVINVATAETTPTSAAIVATVDAGCSPVRMAETADQSTLWVAVRGDNHVLAFSTGMLELNAGNALVGYASTGGTAPVGIALLDNDKLLAVANSNRFGGGTANATILSVGTPASASVVQTVSTGLFPREVSLGPDGKTLYLTNYSSDSLQVIATTAQ